jgi:hypothetical protein
MKSYQEFIASLELEAERLNLRLLLVFTISLAALLPAIIKFLTSLSTLDLSNYLSPLTAGGAIELSYQPALNWLSSYINANFFLTIAAVFLLLIGYHLYVVVYVARFISWISKKTKQPLGYYQVYNSLLLVYAVKTLIDVFVIGIFFNWLFVGIENAVEYSIWVENIGLYLWLYFILKNIRRVESPKSKVESPQVTGL